MSLLLPSYVYGYDSPITRVDPKGLRSPARALENTAKYTISETVTGELQMLSVDNWNMLADNINDKHERSIWDSRTVILDMQEAVERKTLLLMDCLSDCGALFREMDDMNMCMDVDGCQDKCHEKYDPMIEEFESIIRENKDYIRDSMQRKTPKWIIRNEPYSTERDQLQRGY